MSEPVTAAQRRRVARLRRRDARSETGLFLLEGPQALREALHFRPELLEEVYASEEALARHPELASGAGEQGIRLQRVSERTIASMADTVTPQGVLAVCRQFPAPLEAALTGARLVAVLDHIRDPGNAGTILRAADAAGADAVVFTAESVDVYNPKVVRSTTGSLFHVPVVVEADIDEVIGSAAAQGLQTVAADIRGDDFRAARAAGELARPTAWVFGNEAHGLPADIVERLDRSWRLPIFGRAESLNLATAASVCLYESAFALADADPGALGS